MQNPECIKRFKQDCNQKIIISLLNNLSIIFLPFGSWGGALRNDLGSDMEMVPLDGNVAWDADAAVAVAANNDVPVAALCYAHLHKC